MNDLRRTLRSVTNVPPHESLREATLTHALASWNDTPPREHWIDRLWTSRRLRLAWAISLLLLAALDVVATPGAVPGISRSGPTLTEARLALANATAFADARREPRSGS